MNDLAIRTQTVCLVVLAVVAVGFALAWSRPFMLPFLLAVFLWLGLSSLTDFQTERFGLPRAVAIPITIGLAIVLFFVMASLISASVSQMATNAVAYSQQFSSLLKRISASIPDELEMLRSGIQLENLVSLAISRVTGFVAGTTNALVAVVSNAFLVTIFLVFLSVGGKGGRPRATGTWAEIELRIKRYILLKVAISALTGAAVGCVLWVLGVPMAMAFGFFAFLLNFIPNVGSIVATLLPVPVVIGSPALSPTAAVLAIAVPGTLQILIGNFLEPKLMGESLDLHPVVVLIALIGWGMLWGIPGMLLAAPITAMVKLLLEQHEPARPIAELMAGRIDALRSPDV